MALAGCGASETAADRAARNGVLLVGNGTDPNTLDPQQLVGLPEANIVRALSEGLVVQDPDDSAAVRPGVAESWTHNADFTRWTFQLRKEARWSDGTLFTAADFLFSFRRILSSGLRAGGADSLFVLSNARAFYGGRITDFAKVGVAAPDPYTLVLTTEAPTPNLLPMLTRTSFLPVNMAAVESGGAIDSKDNHWADAGTYVGNGPFLLTDRRIGRYVLVERNPQYWDAANVKLNAIRYLPIADPKDELTAFLNGELHITKTVPDADIARLRKSHPDFLMTDELLGANYYTFNVDRAPMNDAKVRRALGLAIDRVALLKQFGVAGQHALVGMVPPGMPDYAALGAPASDPAAARRLLAEAGYPAGKGFPAVTILINRLARNRQIAEAIAAMWKQTLGIDVGIRETDWKTYLDATASGDFQIARAGWIYGYFDPLAILGVFETGSSTNETNWHDPHYDALLAKARNSSDPAERTALLKEAEAFMLQQQPLVPLFSFAQSYLIDPRVKGWGHNINGDHAYKFVSLSAN